MKKLVFGALCLVLSANVARAVVLGAGVTHSFVYYSDDAADVIGVNCGLLHFCEYNTAKVARLSAEDAVCDGQPHGATVTVDEGFVGEPKLEYSTADGKSLDGPPSEPGAYKATMSCAGKSVSRSFKITGKEVARIGERKYVTLNEAIAAAVEDDVIWILADIDGVDITVDKKITIVGGDFTLTGKAQTHAVKVLAGGVLTVSGGNYLTEAETQQALFLVDRGASEAKYQLVISGGTFGGAMADELVKVSGGSVELSGGIFNVSGTCGIKADGPDATVYISGAEVHADGKIAYAADNGGLLTVDGGGVAGGIQLEGSSDASKIEIMDGFVDGEIQRKDGTAKGTILIPGDSHASFDRDQSAWCAEGYRTEPNAQTPPRYAVVKIPPMLMPGQASDAYETRGEAAAAAAATEVLPAEGFGLTGDALARWQGFFVNQVYLGGDGKFRIMPELNADGSNALAQAEAKLTRAINVSAIAAATGAIDEMVLEGAEPGFYYTLFKSADVTTVLDRGSHDPLNSDRKALSDGKVTFTNVTKPSAAAGFFAVRAFVKESFTEPALLGD